MSYNEKVLSCTEDYGVQMADIPRIIADISQGSIATNPIVLTQDELHELLAARI